MPLAEMMRRNKDPGEEVPWVLKRFVDFLSKFGLEVNKAKTQSTPSQPRNRTRNLQPGLKLYFVP